ncbi:bifunctional DNA primase/polymerase [Streptomyces sp. NPDC051133]|uniref:bifunctional DNA primase/polymerase n=1 Tax=Streptomyces sp. NPDC051133 TaxID=3155521 RepID=UPI00342921AA
MTCRFVGDLKQTKVTRTICVPRPGESNSPAAPASSMRPHAVARWCAARGWPVHPLAPGRKTPVANCPKCREERHDPKACPCLPAGLPCHGFHAATLSTAFIDSWWRSTPTAGVGVACGPAGLVVIDVDAHRAEVPQRGRLLPGIPIHDEVDLTGLASGFDTLALLAAYRQQMNPAEDRSTLRVRTPSGGLHIWYRKVHPQVRFRSSTGSSPKVALAWQVDVRADNGYIIAPSTCTAQGAYQAEGSARSPSPLPAWLHEELVRTGHAKATSFLPSPSGRSAARATFPSCSEAAERVLGPLIETVLQCAAAPEGTGFTEKLNRAAYTAGGLVAANYFNATAVQDQLLAAADKARPWQTDRNRRIVSEGLAAGAARPFYLKERS